MKTSILIVICVFFLIINCFSQNGYEMKLGETVNVDANGNVLSSKLNSGNSTTINSTKTTSYNDDGTYKIPGYTPSGNKSVDEQNYKKAKLLLYQNNPDEFNRIYNNPNVAKIVTTISNEEFLSLPENKQEYILSHPELYYIELNNQGNK